MVYVLLEYLSIALTVNYPPNALKARITIHALFMSILLEHLNLNMFWRVFYTITIKLTRQYMQTQLFFDMNANIIGLLQEVWWQT